jgi:uncharacterized membrane protein YbaN (DUF454 family)
MPRRTKAFAIAVMWVFVAISIVFTVDHPAVRLAIAALAIVGTLYILVRVPTRERVLERSVV